MGNRSESELLFEQVTISETSIAGGSDVVRCRLIENSPGLLPPRVRDSGSFRLKTVDPTNMKVSDNNILLYDSSEQICVPLSASRIRQSIKLLV